MERRTNRPAGRRIHRLALAMVLLIAALCTPGGAAKAQLDASPALGGLTHELGMPPVYKGRAGFELGWYRPQTASDPSGLFNLGLAKSLGSPVVGIAGLRLEGYLGVTREELDGGGRALWEIPSFHIGAGVDYNVPDDVFDFLLALDLPLRRGGVVGRGTTIGIRWLPSRDQTVTFGVNVPLWGGPAGKTRPPRDHVRLPKRTPRRLELDLAESELAALLDELRERAHWVVRLTQPFAEHSGADPQAAMAPVLAELTEHMDAVGAHFPQGHTLPAEIAAYHRTLDRAFTVAADCDPGTGADISRQARSILLDDVLLPYNYLLGQRKNDDSLLGYVAAEPARALFAPFARFSPEWQAVAWCNERGIPVRAIDQPMAVTLAARDDD